MTGKFRGWIDQERGGLKVGLIKDREFSWIDQGQGSLEVGLINNG